MTGSEKPEVLKQLDEFIKSHIYVQFDTLNLGMVTLGAFLGWLFLQIHGGTGERIGKSIDDDLLDGNL